MRNKSPREKDRSGDPGPFRPSRAGELTVEYGPKAKPDPDMFKGKPHEPSERDKAGMPPLPNDPTSRDRP